MTERAASYLDRTRWLLGQAALDALSGKRVAIAGCGGVGGAAAITLARMGVGAFRLADPGVFDPPDINRQWGASQRTLGKNKAQVHAGLVRDIHPELEVDVLPEGLTETNLDGFLEGVDFVVDSLDLSVPATLRGDFYRRCWERAVPCVSAPVIGLGTLVAISLPGGMPMLAFGAAVSDALAAGRLPERFWRLFAPAHVTTISAGLSTQKAPTIAISPTLATAVVCTEALMVLAGSSVPGWRPPVALPNLLAVDLARLTVRTAHVTELMPRKTAAMAFDDDVDRGARERNLVRAGYNTLLLPAPAVTVDLLTDSWSELPDPPRLEPNPVLGALRVEDGLKGLFGYEHVVPVFRGRFAEALLATALIRPGGVVAAHALFPTTRFHLTSNGARLVEIGASPEPASSPGDVDLGALARLLEAEQVQAIYLELCVNALGGQPISLDNLRAAHRLARAAGVPLVLDGSRALANASLLRQRDPGCAGLSTFELARRLCAASDACASSLTKDFRSTVGGFIGVRSPELATQIRDLAVLGYGDGLTPAQRAEIAQALASADDCADTRAGRVHTLWSELAAASVPVVAPCGGHAVFVDARELLPDVAPSAFPAQTACAALFAIGGIRAAPNITDPAEDGAWIRLAVPVGDYSDAATEHVTATFRRLQAERGRWKGLRQTAVPPGMLGAFSAQFAPHEASSGPGGNAARPGDRSSPVSRSA